jgi:hypothetical protein
MNPYYDQSSPSGKASSNIDTKKEFGGTLYTTDSGVDISKVRPFFEKCYLAGESDSNAESYFSSSIKANLYSNHALYVESLRLMIELENVDPDVLDAAVKLTEDMDYVGRHIVTLILARYKSKGVIRESILDEYEGEGELTVGEFLRIKYLELRNPSSNGVRLKETTLEKKNKKRTKLIVNVYIVFVVMVTAVIANHFIFN